MPTDRRGSELAIARRWAKLELDMLRTYHLRGSIPVAQSEIIFFERKFIDNARSS
jgi:hypothetical protein